MKDILLWLDDVRPAPAGWVRVYDVNAAKMWLRDGLVLRASLDHDLGACDECTRTDEQAWTWNACRHVPTGYDLVKWMCETGHWPKEKPVVHSQNPVGAAAMRQLIDRHFPG